MSERARLLQPALLDGHVVETVADVLDQVQVEDLARVGAGIRVRVSVRVRVRVEAQPGAG